jgi:hypothetical protein
LPNVWLGVSTEDQERADERIPDLLASPAAVRWISAEPLLGPLDIQRFVERCHAARDGDCFAKTCPQLREGEPHRSGRHCPLDTWGDSYEDEPTPLLNWVVIGGESGPKARPMHPDWLRTIIRDCKASGTPLFFKQWGRWKPVLDRDNDDLDWQAKYTTWGRSPRHRWLNLAGGQGFHGERVHVMAAVGKNAAGFEIDGQTYREFPR